MEETHILVPDLRGRSVLYCSSNASDTLIVFIHGFGGDVIRTWGEFDTALRYDNSFQNSDIIFYGYNSLKYHMHANALIFYDWLDHWISKPPAPPFLVTRNYNNIVIVAHSLGALVTRQTLLYAYNDNKKWVNQTKMILFAPAHKGARIIDLCFKCLPGFYAASSLVAHWLFPVLGDLKEGSEPIKEIIKINEELLKAGKGDFSKAIVTVHAIRDRTIIGGLYCKDPTPLSDYDHDHIQLCKPRVSDYEEPIKYLKKAIL